MSPDGLWLIIDKRFLTPFLSLLLLLNFFYWFCWIAFLQHSLVLVLDYVHTQQMCVCVCVNTECTAFLVSFKQADPRCAGQNNGKYQTSVAAKKERRRRRDGGIEEWGGTRERKQKHFQTENEKMSAFQLQQHSDVTALIRGSLSEGI